MTEEQPIKPPPPQPNVKVVDSNELFGGLRTVLIRHNGEFYRLLRTKNGKLILQK